MGKGLWPGGGQQSAPAFADCQPNAFFRLIQPFLTQMEKPAFGAGFIPFDFSLKSSISSRSRRDGQGFVSCLVFGMKELCRESEGWGLDSFSGGMTFHRWDSSSLRSSE